MRMRADELVTLTRAEYESLRRQAQQQGELFNAEEMQAIREQYEERVTVAEERREELEWKLRVELAKIRDAELSARRAADEMRRIEQSLLAILEEPDETKVMAGRSAAPQPAAPLTQTPRSEPPRLAKAAPPPLPKGVTSAPRPAPGSQAEKFRAAMANRKRYMA